MDNMYFKPISPPPPPPPPPNQAARDAALNAAKSQVPTAASDEAAAKLGAAGQDEAKGFLGGFGKAIQRATLLAQVQPIDPQQALADVAKLEAELKAAKTPEDLQALTKRTDELQGRAMVSVNPALPSELLKQVADARDHAEAANQAVAALQSQNATLAKSSDLPGRAVLAANLLANPADLQAHVAALGPLAGSPLMEQAKAWAGGIAKLATPQMVGEQLAKDPDLSHYPPSAVADLAKLRAIPDSQLQKGLDGVGSSLIARSAAARQAGAAGEHPADPLSLEAVSDNPALGQLIAPMQASADPAVRAQVQAIAGQWAQRVLENNLAANRGGPPTDPNANAKNSIDGFQRDLGDLANKTGLDTALQASIADATQAVAVRELNNKDVNFDALKKNPALGQLLAQLKDDPAYKDQVGAKMREIIGQGVDEHMANEKRDKGVKDGMGKLKDDLVALATSTGLGAEIGANIEGAMQDRHKSIEDATNRGKGFFDHLSDFASGAFSDLAKVVAEPFKLIGSADAAMFNAVGLHGLADATQGFSNGIGDGLAGSVNGFGTMIAHPLAAAKGMAEMAMHPSRLEAAGKAIFDEAMKGGLAHGLGYAVGTLAPTLLGGGSAAALVGRGVGSLAAKQIPVISAIAARTGQVSGLGLKGLALAKGVVGQDIAKVATTIATDTTKLDELRPLAEIGDRTLAKSTKTVIDGAKDAGHKIKDVAQANDRSLAAKTLLNDTAKKAKDAVVASSAYKDKVIAIKAIKTPRLTARQLVDHLKDLKTSAREAKDIYKNGTGLAADATRMDRVMGAGTHAVEAVGTVIDSEVGKLGQLGVAGVGLAINPAGFLKNHLPGAVFTNQVQNKYKKLNIDNQARFDQANQIYSDAQLAAALDLKGNFERGMAR